jgi:carbon-monoxide dehydrogenase small subunit/xanthine dehydrogenase YagT iron-sulfur-binding subunit
MLADDPGIDRDAAAEALGGNLCRCGCYSRILDAVDLAAQQIRSHSSKEQ